MADSIDRAIKSRQYAENLIGPNQRGYLDTQRQVAQDVHNTNWKSIQNNFAQLKDQLEAKRVKSNRAFNEGLVDVADNSFDRVNASSRDLVNRGLTTSGLSNVMTQADTTQKGEDVNKLLAQLGGDINAQVSKLAEGVTKTAQAEQKLNAGTSDTLGKIGEADLANQMNYNQGAAGIAAGKDARDDQNALEAARRALSGGSGGGKSKGVSDAEKELNNKASLAAATSILLGVDLETGEKLKLTDAQKARELNLTLGFGKDMNDAQNLVADFKYNTQVLKKRDAQIKEQEGIQNTFGNNNLSLNRQDARNLYSKASNQDKMLDEILNSDNQQTADKRAQLLDYLSQANNIQENNLQQSPTLSPAAANQLLRELQLASPNDRQLSLNEFGVSNLDKNPVGSGPNLTNMSDLIQAYNQYNNRDRASENAIITGQAQFAPVAEGQPSLSQILGNRINNRPQVVNARDKINEINNTPITYRDLLQYIQHYDYYS